MQRAIEYLTILRQDAKHQADLFEGEFPEIESVYRTIAFAYDRAVFALREAPVEPETKHVNLSRFRECLRAAGVDDPTISKVLGALAASMRGRMVHAD